MVKAGFYQIPFLSLQVNGASANGSWLMIIGNPVKNGSSTRCCDSLLLLYQ